MAEERSGPDGEGEAMAGRRSPGDQAVPGTGQVMCRDCHGTGLLEDRPCPSCGGTGFVTQILGDA
ncbi:MAG TPA: hypothetical protein VE684_07820 [Crenalkalicoccus sp.]|jgi:DnaJ-class molecular chaperone|nr:hypothetical protein [Crenalkalicoccus sp.]